MIRLSPLQRGQTSGKTTSIRASSSAQVVRAARRRIAAAFPGASSVPLDDRLGVTIGAAIDPVASAAGTRLEALMDPVFGVDFTPVLQREGRSSAGAQQPFQVRAVGAFDAHAGVGREAATVRRVRHRLGVFRLEHTAAGERAQQTPADPGLDFVEPLEAVLACGG
jgi:hypothetical protein